MIIHNSDELVKAFDCKSREHLERCLYKYTNCGMSIWFKDEKSVTITGYVENDSDYCGPDATFVYPFQFEEFSHTADILDEKACRIWDVLNGEEYEDEPEQVKWEIVCDIQNGYLE